MKLRSGQKLVVASHNAGKVREINELINPFGLNAISAGELGLPEPIEDGDSFAANAIIKAVAAANASGLPALADDSGLEVHGLDGAPGIYSARWGGDAGDFNLAMSKVNDELLAKNLSEDADRTANFTCALALAFPQNDADTNALVTDPLVYEGKVFGRVVWPIRGELGFGYDPMFIADGETITFGEMDPARKHEMSHRANAFKLFKEACLEQQTN